MGYHLKYIERSRSRSPQSQNSQITTQHPDPTLEKWRYQLSSRSDRRHNQFLDPESQLGRRFNARWQQAVILTARWAELAIIGTCLPWSRNISQHVKRCQQQSWL